MKPFLVLAFAGALLSGQTPQGPTAPSEPPALAPERNQTTDANVNSRYTVESVGIVSPRRYQLSKSLTSDMQRLVGARFSSEVFQNIAQRISSEMHGWRVVFRLARGTEPGRVRVTFEVNGPKTGFDIDIPEALYNSQQGWSGEGDATVGFGNNNFMVGLLSDGDTHAERVAGIRTRYDRLSVGSERVRLSFEFDSLHDQFDPQTMAVAARENDLTNLYRSRQNLEPTVAVTLAEPLVLTMGFSFEQLDPVQDLPVEWSNAFVTDLHYRKDWDETESGKHRVDAVYSLRAATTLLGAAYAYTRHMVDASYHWKRGRQSAQVAFAGGMIQGRAPLYDRFVLGNSVALRGWNKYELDPLGGTRMAYGSVEYGYRMMRAFLDTGAIWDRGRSADPKQSAGVGVKVEGVLIAVAFPLRNDRMEPVFIAGMNF